MTLAKGKLQFVLVASMMIIAKKRVGRVHSLDDQDDCTKFRANYGMKGPHSCSCIICASSDMTLAKGKLQFVFGRERECRRESNL